MPLDNIPPVVSDHENDDNDEDQALEWTNEDFDLDNNEESECPKTPFRVANSPTEEDDDENDEAEDKDDHDEDDDNNKLDLSGAEDEDGVNENDDINNLNIPSAEIAQVNDNNDNNDPMQAETNNTNNLSFLQSPPVPKDHTIPDVPIMQPAHDNNNGTNSNDVPMNDTNDTNDNNDNNGTNSNDVPMNDTNDDTNDNTKSKDDVPMDDTNDNTNSKDDFPMNDNDDCPPTPGREQNEPANDSVPPPPPAHDNNDHDDDDTPIKPPPSAGNGKGKEPKANDQNKKPKNKKVLASQAMQIEQTATTAASASTSTAAAAAAPPNSHPLPHTLQPPASLDLLHSNPRFPPTLPLPIAQEILDAHNYTPSKTNIISPNYDPTTFQIPRHLAKPKAVQKQRLTSNVFAGNDDGICKFAPQKPASASANDFPPLPKKLTMTKNKNDNSSLPLSSKAFYKRNATYFSKAYNIGKGCPIIDDDDLDACKGLFTKAVRKANKKAITDPEQRNIAITNFMYPSATSPTKNDTPLSPLINYHSTFIDAFAHKNPDDPEKPVKHRYTYGTAILLYLVRLQRQTEAGSERILFNHLNDFRSIVILSETNSLFYKLKYYQSTWVGVAFGIDTFISRFNNLQDQTKNLDKESQEIDKVHTQLNRAQQKVVKSIETVWGSNPENDIASQVNQYLTKATNDKLAIRRASIAHYKKQLPTASALNKMLYHKEFISQPVYIESFITIRPTTKAKARKAHPTSFLFGDLIAKALNDKDFSMGGGNMSMALFVYKQLQKIKTIKDAIKQAETSNKKRPSPDTPQKSKKSGDNDDNDDNVDNELAELRAKVAALEAKKAKQSN